MAKYDPNETMSPMEQLRAIDEDLAIQATMLKVYAERSKTEWRDAEVDKQLLIIAKAEAAIDAADREFLAAEANIKRTKRKIKWLTSQRTLVRNRKLVETVLKCQQVIKALGGNVDEEA